MLLSRVSRRTSSLLSLSLSHCCCRLVASTSVEVRRLALGRRCCRPYGSGDPGAGGGGGAARGLVRGAAVWRRSRGGDGELLEERGGATRSAGVTTEGDMTSCTSSMLWDELRELLGEYLADLRTQRTTGQVTVRDIAHSDRERRP